MRPRVIPSQRRSGAAGGKNASSGGETRNRAETSLEAIMAKGRRRSMSWMQGEFEFALVW
jgi:hypothetical protein